MSEKDVLDLVARWADVELKGDADGYGDLFTEDFSGVGPVGFVLDKQAWAGRHRGDMKNEAFAIVEPQVRFYGDDTAVVMGVQDQTTKVAGHDTSGKFRMVAVVVRQDGGWRIANVQLSGPLRAPGQMPDFAKKEG
jgi:uncharacterized protein (TIGR02246 family)